MSIFKTKGIILKIHKNNEKNISYTIFTHDYGKIFCQKKLSTREKTLDIGYLINFEIETKQENKFHKIRNVKIQHQLNTQNKGFGFINNFLEIIALLGKSTPEGYPYNNIIPLFERFFSLENQDQEKLLLLRAGILKIFGNLPDHHSDKVLQKILKFIHSSQNFDFLKLKNTPDTQKKKLEDLLRSL